MHHIGSASDGSFEVNWDTEWIPDQPEPMQIAARVIDEKGIIYFCEPVVNLTFEREDFSVELCKPRRVRWGWTTRQEDKGEYFNVNGDLSKISGVKMIWTSWSPCYMNGIFINGQKVFHNEGPCYNYYAHEVNLTDLSILKHGENYLHTGVKKTNADGRNIHGMEVQWPGIMILVRYNLSADVGIEDKTIHKSNDFKLLPNYPNPFNPTTYIPYSLKNDSMIDLSIHSINGSEVMTLEHGEVAAGYHVVRWDGTNELGEQVPSGVYLYKLQINEFSLSRKMLFLK